MTKILLISPLSEASRFKTLIESVAHYQLTYSELKDVHQVLRDDPDHDVIVFDCYMLHKQQIEYLERLSGLFEGARILITADQISIYSYQHVHSMSNMVTLQKPFQDNLLLTLLDRVASHADFKPSRCPRFITNEPVRMVVLETGLLIPTRMRNYSASGAFLEYRGISLKVGDQIQISLQEDQKDVKENMQMQAQVIWIKEGEHNRSPMRGVGVKFLDA